MTYAESLKAGARHVGVIYTKPHINGYFFRTALDEISETVEHHANTSYRARLMRRSEIRKFARQYRV